MKHKIFNNKQSKNENSEPTYTENEIQIINYLFDQLYDPGEFIPTKMLA